MVGDIDAPPSTGFRACLGETRIFTAFLFVCILAVAVGIFKVSLVRNINWDEFKYLSHIYESQSGNLRGVFQMGHVLLFGWLTHVGEQEVDQILAARTVYFTILLLTALLIFGIARKFASLNGSALAVLVFLTCSDVILHGTSFRTDGLSAFLLMSSLYLLLRCMPSKASFALAGCLWGAAAFITIKASLYGLVFFPLLLIGVGVQYPSVRLRLSRGAAFCFAAVGCFLLLTVGQWTYLDPTPVPPGGRLANAASTTLFSTGFLPQLAAFQRSVFFNPALWFLVGTGVLFAASRCVRALERRRSLTLLVLTLPLITLLFYRNSYPYYYVFLLPPVLIVAATGYDELIRRCRRRALLIRWTLLLLLVGSALATVLQHSKDTISNQRALIDGIREVFPAPAPHINGVGFLASYPKVGFFMSSWKMSDYVREGEAVFPKMVMRLQPHFLIADVPHLEIFDYRYPSRGGHTFSVLLEEDRRFLREQFIHHWGPLYVPGAQFSLDTASVRKWTVTVEGLYTLESTKPVRLNDTRYEPGATIYLQQGENWIEGDEEATLRWGNHLRYPTAAAPAPPIFLHQ